MNVEYRRTQEVDAYIYVYDSSWTRLATPNSLRVVGATGALTIARTHAEANEGMRAVL
jgi:hypothetical protein